MRQTGLTLVELMVTLAIVSILAVAALTVVTDLRRVEGMESRRQAEATALAPLGELIEWDVAHATHYRPAPGRVLLETQASLDATTLERRHLPATVEYTLREVGPRRWLVRIQRPQASGAALAELVARDVGGVRIELVDPPPDAAPANPDEWQPLSAVVAITVTPDGGNRPPAVFRIRRN